MALATEERYDWRLAGHRPDPRDPIPGVRELSGVDFVPDDFLVPAGHGYMIFGGTSAITEWVVPAAVELELKHFHPLEKLYAVVDAAVHRVPTQPFSIKLYLRPRQSGRAWLTGSLAGDLKSLSGLHDAELALLLPVARETFQRWRAGTLNPSAPNLRRLRSLATYFRDLYARVPSVHDWLYSPLDSVNGAETPYDLLRQARYTEAWQLAAQSPLIADVEVKERPDGMRTGVMRQAPGFDQELDEYEPDLSDWDDEE